MALSLIVKKWNKYLIHIKKYMHINKYDPKDANLPAGKSG